MLMQKWSTNLPFGLHWVTFVLIGKIPEKKEYTSMPFSRKDLFYYKHIHKRIPYNNKSVPLVSSFKDEKAMQKKMRIFL